MKFFEDKLQADCYKWAHNSYPKIRGLLCYNLNNSRNKIDGAKNKIMGLQPGRADMTLYLNGTAYMIEFKTVRGVQSLVQKKWEKKIKSEGFQYYIIRSVDEFKSLMKKLLY